MPILKPISGHGSTGGIRRYLEKGGRALARDLFNLSYDERDAGALGNEAKEACAWDAEMDATRAAFGTDAPWRGKPARTFKHFVLSPDPGDDIDLAALRELACSWALKHFGDHEIAIVYHDDNARGIPHAHIVVNNANLRTGYRMQTQHPEDLNRDLQDMARERGLSGLSNDRAPESPSKARGRAGAGGPRSRRSVYLGRAEKEIMRSGGYSWVGDIRARVALAKTTARDEAEFLRAVAAAEAADAAVIFAGLPECAELAATDRRHMRLPECQNNLIARVAAVQKNTVVVLHTSGPVECPWADDVSSVLCMYLAGEGLGEATDALLWGDADPCGRLPETWPLRLEDTPCYLDFPGDGVTADYREGVYVGYRWYDARKMPVRWPFGHGLSYTGYVYRGAALDDDTLTPGGTLTARVTVKNSGAMRGAEVVQLYVADATGAPVPGGRVPQALRRFAKIDLQPGEEREVVFTLTPQDISRYSPELHAWCAAPGRYEIRSGHSSRDIRAVLALQYADAKI